MWIKKGDDMVKCAFCVAYVRGRCTESKSPMYREVIDDPYKEIDCPYYIDIAGAGILSMGLI